MSNFKKPLKDTRDKRKPNRALKNATVEHLLDILSFFIDLKCQKV